MVADAAAFSACFFAWNLATSLMVDRGVALLGIEATSLVYAAALLAGALGGLSFWITRRLMPELEPRRTLGALVASLCIMGALGMVVTPRAPGFFTAATVVLIMLGYLFAAYHYGSAMTFQGYERTGTTLGLGMGLAVLLQALVESLTLVKVAFVASITVSVLVALWVSIRPWRDWMFEDALPYSSSPPHHKLAGVLTASAVLMTLNYGLLDGFLVWQGALGRVQMGLAPSLAYAASLALAGFLFDVRAGRIRAISTCCAMLLALVAAAALGMGDLNVATLLFSVYGGFFVAYISVTFVRLAPKTSAPELVAGLGRLVGMGAGSACALLTRPVLSGLGGVGVIGTSWALSAATLVVLARDIAGDADEQNQDETNDETGAAAGETPQPPTREEALGLYAAAHGLTPRETDVFYPLLTTEKSVQEIADELYVSRRVTQRYIASIYEKTATKSRIGLYQSFDAWREGR